MTHTNTQPCKKCDEVFKDKETTWQCKSCGFEYTQTLEIDEYLTRMWCPNCNKLMKKLKGGEANNGKAKR